MPSELRQACLDTTATRDRLVLVDVDVDESGLNYRGRGRFRPEPRTTEDEDDFGPNPELPRTRTISARTPNYRARGRAAPRGHPTRTISSRSLILRISMDADPVALREEIRRAGRRATALWVLAAGGPTAAAGWLAWRLSGVRPSDSPPLPLGVSAGLLSAVAVLGTGALAGWAIGALLVAAYRRRRRRQLRRRLAPLAPAAVEALLLPLARDRLDETRSLAYSLFRDARRGSELAPSAAGDGSGQEASPAVAPPLQWLPTPRRGLGALHRALLALLAASTLAAMTWELREFHRARARLPGVAAPPPAARDVPPEFREGPGWRIRRRGYSSFVDYARYPLEVPGPSGWISPGLVRPSASAVSPRFAGADLRRMDAPGAKFHDLSFAGADMRGANLSRAAFPGCDLSSANLSDAYLGAADLGGARLTGANLAGAQYNREPRWPPGFAPQAPGARLGP